MEADYVEADYVEADYAQFTGKQIMYTGEADYERRPALDQRTPVAVPSQPSFTSQLSGNQ